MSDKYISVTELKKKLNYIFRANGVSKCTKEAINGAIKKLPFVFKSELETTLEASSEPKITKTEEEAIKRFLTQKVEFIPNRKDIEDIQMDAVINFANKLMCNLNGDIEAYANAGHSLNVYGWLKSYLVNRGVIKAEAELFGNLEQENSNDTETN